MQVGTVGEFGQCGQPALLQLGTRLRARREQLDTRADLVDPLPHHRRAVGVQPHHGPAQSGADPYDQHLADPPQRSGVGPAHVSVALSPGQRRQRLHQVQHVRIPRGPGSQRLQQPAECLGEVGQQGPFDSPGQVEQSALGACLVDARGGGGFDGCAPDRGLDQADGELRRPARGPGLPEGALALHVAASRLDPADVEQPQPVEQLGPRAVDRLAQVQVPGPDLRLPPHPQGPADPVQIGLQRHSRDPLVHRPQSLADHEMLGDVLDRPLVTIAQHRTGRFGHLGESGERPGAQTGQCLGQPDRLDDVRARRRQVPLPQTARDPGQPAHDGLVRGGPQVVVPARRGHARAIAPGAGQPLVGPRHPGQRDPSPWRPAQGYDVMTGRRQRPADRRCMPCPAHHPDPVATSAERAADDLAHVRLAALLIHRSGAAGQA